VCEKKKPARSGGEDDAARWEGITGRLENRKKGGGTLLVCSGEKESDTRGEGGGETARLQGNDPSFYREKKGVSRPIAVKGIGRLLLHPRFSSVGDVSRGSTEARKKERGRYPRRKWKGANPGG